MKMDRIEKLEKDIGRLEDKLSRDHFGGLIDKASRRRDENKLRKLKKELEELTAKNKKKK